MSAQGDAPERNPPPPATLKRSKSEGRPSFFKRLFQRDRKTSLKEESKSKTFDAPVTTDNSLPLLTLSASSPTISGSSTPSTKPESKGSRLKRSLSLFSKKSHTTATTTKTTTTTTTTTSTTTDGKSLSQSSNPPPKLLTIPEENPDSPTGRKRASTYNGTADSKDFKPPSPQELRDLPPKIMTIPTRDSLPQNGDTPTTAMSGSSPQFLGSNGTTDGSSEASSGERLSNASESDRNDLDMKALDDMIMSPRPSNSGPKDHNTITASIFDMGISLTESAQSLGCSVEEMEEMYMLRMKNGTKARPNSITIQRMVMMSLAENNVDDAAGTVDSTQQLTTEGGEPKNPEPPKPAEQKPPVDHTWAAGIWDEADSESNIMYMPDKNDRPIKAIRAATLPKLVQRLTNPDYPDQEFQAAFLLTYRSFTTPVELLKLLIHRYDRPCPKDTDEETFKKNVLLPIRLRVFNVLKTWLEGNYRDIENDNNFFGTLQDFINNTLAQTMPASTPILNRLLQRLKDPSQIMEFQFSKKPPSAIIPSSIPTITVTNSSNLKMILGANNCKFEFKDIHPEEYARQLSLIQHAMYYHINPRECLGQGWSKKDKLTRAPNITKMINHFNLVSNWVTWEIMKVEDLKQRAITLNRAILIAKKCKDLNNFFGMMGVLSSLQNSSIFRLTQTWSLLPKETWDIFDGMMMMMDGENNFASYRAAINKVNPPCIPYIGVYLTDLTFIEDGNQDTLGEQNLINFQKLKQAYTVITQIQQYQSTPYCYTAVMFLQDYITGHVMKSEKELYQKSLKYQPRNLKVATSKRLGRSPSFSSLKEKKVTSHASVQSVFASPSPSSSSTA